MSASASASKRVVHSILEPSPLPKLVINETLCEILVYSCDQETYVSRTTASVDKLMAEIPDFGNPTYWQQQRNELLQRMLKSVRYNELIGSIEVHFVGTQLRADYWFTDKKRIVIGSRDKGLIKWCGKLLEKDYRGSRLSSEGIFQDFRAALTAEIRHHTRLGRRFADFSIFDRCGPLIDWRSVLKV